MKKKVMLVTLFLVFSIVGTGLVYAFNTLRQVNETITQPKMDESNLAINNQLDIDTINLAVFGIDGRSDVDGDRSDTIMVVSMDFRKGDIKVTSIMRDLLVQIPEGPNNYEYFDKVNAAYSEGGPVLAVKTLNENFDLNIKDYVTINFDAMVDVVDALGGVEINVKDEDILEYTNRFIDDVNDKVKKGDPYLKTTGVQNVTGVQALAYSRNRLSDDDFHRTERQREVVGQLVTKAFDIDLSTALTLLNKVYPYITTTLSLNEITTYAKSFLDSPEKQFLEFRLPLDTRYRDGMISGASYIIPNSLIDNVIALHAFIYGPVVPKSTPATAAIADEAEAPDSALNDDTLENNTTGRSAIDTPITGTNSTTTTNTNTNGTAGGDSAYKAYVPSARVKEISDAIAIYTGGAPSSSGGSGGSYTDDDDYSYSDYDYSVDDDYYSDDYGSDYGDESDDDSTGGGSDVDSTEPTEDTDSGGSGDPVAPSDGDSPGV